MTRGQLVGYQRVSTDEQNTERQLEGVDVDKMFTDYASGKDTRRPKLRECLGYVREGDTLVVHSMDRLARSLKDLFDIVDDLTRRGVTVRFTNPSLTFSGDQTDPCNRLILQVLGACYEFERAIMLQRQREGIAIAKRAGKYKGRAWALSADQAATWCGVWPRTSRRPRWHENFKCPGRRSTAVATARRCWHDHSGGVRGADLGRPQHCADVLG